MPVYYMNYQQDILRKVEQIYELASKARKVGLDASNAIESKIAYDLADRVAKMHDIDIASRLRTLLERTTKEKAALKIAEEIALGEYDAGDLRTRLDNAVRVSLAVVTEGVTVAPLQGISNVQLKNNSDGRYLPFNLIRWANTVRWRNRSGTYYVDSRSCSKGCWYK